MRYLKNEKSQLIMWLRVIGVLKNNQKTQVVLMTFKTYFELGFVDKKKKKKTLNLKCTMKNKLEWSHKTLYTHSVFQHCQRLMSIFLSRSFLGCFTRKEGSCWKLMIFSMLQMLQHLEYLRADHKSRFIHLKQINLIITFARNITSL